VLLPGKTLLQAEPGFVHFCGIPQTLGQSSGHIFRCSGLDATGAFCLTRAAKSGAVAPFEFVVAQGDSGPPDAEDSAHDYPSPLRRLVPEPTDPQ
jgi:hypothetical protein